MAFFDFLFGKNAADTAMPYLEQIPQQAAGYLEPYREQGSQATDTTMPLYQSMAQDPTGFMEQLFSNYKPSPGYQLSADLMGQAMGNTAAAGGYAGTEADQLRRGQLIQGLLDQDKYNWLNSALGIQGQGLGGLEGFTGRGFGAGSELADINTQALSSQAGAAFQGQQQRNQNQMDLIKGLMNFMSAGGMGGDKDKKDQASKAAQMFMGFW